MARLGYNTLTLFNWGLVASTAIGFAFTSHLLGAEYLILTLLICIVSLSFCYFCPMSPNTLFPFGVFFIYIHCSYIFKFFVILLYPTCLNFAYPKLDYSSLREDSFYTALTCVFLSLIGLVAAYFLSLLFIPFEATDSRANRYSKTFSDRHLYFAGLISTAIFIVCYSTVHSLGFFAGNVSALPWRLGGVLNLALEITFPALILYIIWCASTDSSLKRWTYFSYAMLLLHTIAQVFLRTSKGVVFHITLLLFLLHINSKPNQRLGKLIWALLVLGGVVSFQFGYVFRSTRASDSRISDSVAEISAHENLFGHDGLMRILMRFPGAETILGIVNRHDVYLGWDAVDELSRKRHLTGYFSNSFHRIPESSAVGMAPGPLGLPYIVFGEIGVLVGIIVIILLLRILWRVSDLDSVRAKPLIKCLISYFICTSIQEGTWDLSVTTTFPVLLFTCLLCETLHRIGRPKVALA